ncbi:MAG: InlB B-repeat-containing protein [Bifidobacteriaceae bacterium]|jgi:hypothetical protein|nr:InlB B-repeat-containing protein [Bifidobacteriaceae bacterium]
MTIRPSLARAALACVFATSLVPLMSGPPSSFAEPPCALQEQVDTALANSSAGVGQSTVVLVEAACAVEESVALRVRPEGLDPEETVYITLSGQTVLRGNALDGPMFVVNPGFGLILNDIELNGGGSNRPALPASAPIVRVEPAGLLTVGAGAALTGNAGRAIINHGSTTVNAASARISDNVLSVRASDAIPGGAAILTEARGLTVITDGVISNNVVKAVQSGGAPAPNVAGAAIISVGQTSIQGGQFTDNSFQAPDSTSFGGAAAAVTGSSGSAGSVVVVNGASSAPQFVGNTASRGGAIASLSTPADGPGVLLAGGVIAGNMATLDGGAAYANGGSLRITSGAVIGTEDLPNQAGRADRSGVVNASGTLELSGDPIFAGGNGITASSEDTAPVIVDRLTGGEASVLLESIPYFAAVGSDAEVIAARAGGSLGSLTPQDVAALTQRDPVVELALADAGSATAALAVARYRALPVTYHGIEGTSNHPDNPDSVTFITRTTELLPPVEPEGKHFVGWFDAAEDGNVVAAIGQGTSAPVDVWARFVPTYKVNYLSKAGNQVSNLPVDASAYYQGRAATVLAETPLRPGYEFLGWSTAEDGGSSMFGPGDTLGELSAEVSLWAQWRAVAYEIDYHGPAGDNPASYTVEDGVIVLGDPPVPSGYRFLGWYNQAEGGQRIETIPAGVTGKFAVWPKFERIDVPTPPPSTTPPATPTTTPPAPPSTTPPAPPSTTPPAAPATTPAPPASTPVVTPPPSSTPTPDASVTQPAPKSTSAPKPKKTKRPTASPVSRPVSTPVRSSAPATSPAPVVLPPTPAETPTPETPTPVETPSVSSSPSPTKTSASPEAAPAPEVMGPPPASSAREAAGWSLIAVGSAGLMGLGGYWFRRVLQFGIRAI